MYCIHFANSLRGFFVLLWRNSVFFISVSKMLLKKRIFFFVMIISRRKGLNHLIDKCLLTNIKKKGTFTINKTKVLCKKFETKLYVKNIILWKKTSKKSIFK